METSSLCVTQWTQNWSRSRLFGRTIDLAYEQLKKAICCTLNAMVVNLWYLVINNATMICLVGYLLWILLINMSHCLCCNYLWPMSWLDATRVATAHWFSLQQCTILCKGASHLSYLDTICSMNPSQRDWFSFFSNDLDSPVSSAFVLETCCMVPAPVQRTAFLSPVEKRHKKWPSSRVNSHHQEYYRNRGRISLWLHNPAFPTTQIM